METKVVAIRLPKLTDSKQCGLKAMEQIVDNIRASHCPDFLRLKSRRKRKETAGADLEVSRLRRLQDIRLIRIMPNP